MRARIAVTLDIAVMDVRVAVTADIGGSARGNARSGGLVALIPGPSRAEYSGARGRVPA